MSIIYKEDNRTITIHTANTTYQMRITRHGFLQHTYYGKKIEDEDMSYLFLQIGRASCRERV